MHKTFEFKSLGAYNRIVYIGRTETKQCLLKRYLNALLIGLS